jgi:beta-glucanase (GH16 family)
MTGNVLSKQSRRRDVVAGALFSLLACATTVSAEPAGWALNWQDDFDGTAINATRWERLTRRDSYNNEKQYYLANQATVGNGNLRITATNQPFDGKAYRSGLVRTWQEQTYGRWEIRASLPTGQGMWPAIWLLPRNVSWPMGGEIDIMENRGSAPTVVGSAYHYGPSVAGHQWVAQDFAYNVNNAPVSFHNAMHTYAVEWDPSRIRYFVDGIPHFTFYQGTAPISSSPMSLILNLAVGGDYGGDPNGTTSFPQHFDIDYVSVYNRNNATRGLENGGFESTSGEFFTDWNEYSNAVNVRVDSNPANSRTGTNAVQMYGRFNGNALNNSGLYQEVPTVAGEVWQLGAFARNRPSDALAGTNTAGIKIEFVDANGSVINVGNLDVANSASPSVYRESVVRRVAPPGAVFARAVLEMVQRNSAGGAVNFDDATLRRVTGSSIAGDINLDGTRNSLDLDALLHSLANVNLAFDFDGNSQVNQSDVDSILASAFSTVRGDLNLDQQVNFDDLLTLAQNYGQTGTGSWALGDVNGDSNVTFDDVLALAQNYGSSSLVTDLEATGTVASDWQLARSLVPEPSAALLAMLIAPTRKRRGDTSRRRVE